MRTLVLTITLLLGCLMAINAQTNDTAATMIVVLNDGSTLKGERVSAQPGHVKLRLADGTEVEFPIESIAEIRKETPKGRPPRKPHVVREKGLYAIVSAGFLFGNIEQEPLSFTGGAALGYRFFPQLYLAGGTGTDVHLASGDVYTHAFGRIGGEMLKTRVTPHYFFSGGYAFPVVQEGNGMEYFDVKGGPFYEGGIGVTFRNASRISWNLSITYRQYKTQRSYYNEWWWGNSDSYTTELRTIRRFGLGVGMCF